MLFRSEYGYELAGYKPRIKWIPLQAKDNQPWSAGVNIEYAKLKTGMSESSKSAEIRFIFGYEGESWRLAMNPILEKNLSPRTENTPELQTNFRAIFKRDGFLKGIGLEYYLSLGPYNNFHPQSEQAKQLFLVAELEPNESLLKDWDIHIAAGKGWDSADSFTIKMIIGPKF